MPRKPSHTTCKSLQRSASAVPANVTSTRSLLTLAVCNTGQTDRRGELSARGMRVSVPIGSAFAATANVNDQSAITLADAARVLHRRLRDRGRRGFLNHTKGSRHV